MKSTASNATNFFCWDIFSEPNQPQNKLTLGDTVSWTVNKIMWIQNWKKNYCDFK